MKNLAWKVNQFGQSEYGGATAFALYIFVAFAVLSGVMLDATYGWWNKSRLTAAADIGAHAGAVGIAHGYSEDVVRSQIASVVDDNMPSSRFGQLLSTSADIEFVHYDPETRTFDDLGEPNGVVVQLQQSADRKNPVPTFLLKLAGIDSFDTAAVSAAVFDINAECNSQDGIYAKDKITMSSQTDVGSGFCVHSESQVWLPQQNTFQPGSFVSMPNLAMCEDKCVDSANPGIVAVESHMVLPDLNEMILDTYAALETANMSASPVKQTLFEGVSVGDLTELKEKGIIAEDAVPSKGDVITLSQTQFHEISQFPSGLVYKITCSSGGNGVKTWLNFSGTTGQMSNVGLITNCGLNFMDGSRAVGSVIVTTRDQTTASVTAGSSVTVADPSQSCNADERTIVMSISKVKVPAEFVISNLTLIVDDDVDIASSTSSGNLSRGLAIYATGTVQISSQHTFRVCGNPDLFLTPVGKVLRLVLPPS